MKILVGFLFLSVFLVSCAGDRQSAGEGDALPAFTFEGKRTWEATVLRKTCKSDSDCGFSEKCVNNRCYDI